MEFQVKKYSGKFNWFYFESNKFKSELNAFTKITAHPNQKLYLGTWNTDMVVFDTTSNRLELIKSFKNPEGRAYAPDIYCFLGKIMWLNSEHHLS